MLLLLGCAPSKQLSKLPSIEEGLESAKIYILRPHIFVGDGLAGFIYLNDKPIFSIAAGDYTAFQVPPGKHKVGIMGKGWWDIVMNQVLINCLCGEEYYLKVTNNEIIQISEQLGKEYMTSCKYVPTEIED